MNPLHIQGKALKQLIDASATEKRDFSETAELVKAYSHKASERQLYEGLGLQEELWFRTTVAMTAQAIDLLGPYLYPANPHRTGQVRKHPFAAPEVHRLASARNSLMESYLNLTPEETDLAGESIRCINQSLVYGGGVMWTGYNDRKGIVHSVYDSIENLSIDPDATNWNTVNWVARKWEKPRWKLIDENPQSTQLIAMLKPSKESKSQVGRGNDLIITYEVWLRVGLHRYIEQGMLPRIDENGAPIQYTDAPRKYLVSDDGKILSSSTWEIPYFMDDCWPCEVLSFIDDENSIWPISPMRAGLPFQKALNWLYITYMTKIRFCSRSIFGILESPDADITNDNKSALQSWSDLPFLSIRVKDSTVKLSDVFQQLDLNPNVESFERAHAVIKREFQEHTGLYDILHTGEGDTQDRSATATQFKERTSKTRINYRLDRVIQFQSRLARKEALGARFLHTPEQIDAILGPGTGEIWGRIMPPSEVAPGGQLDPTSVDFQQWFLETDYSVVSSSMRRHDLDAKIDALKEMMNQVVSVQLQSPDLNERAMAYDTMAAYFEAIGGDDALVQGQRQQAQALRQQAAQMQAAAQAQAAQQAALMGQAQQPMGASNAGL